MFLFGIVIASLYSAGFKRYFKNRTGESVKDYVNKVMTSKSIEEFNSEVKEMETFVSLVCEKANDEE